MTPEHVSLMQRDLLPPSFIAPTGGGAAKDAAHLATGIPMYASGLLYPTYLGQPVIRPRMRAMMHDAHSLAARFVREERCHDMLGVLMTADLTDPPAEGPRSARWHSGWRDGFHNLLVCSWDRAYANVQSGKVSMRDALTLILSAELTDRTRVLRAIPRNARTIIENHQLQLSRLYRIGVRVLNEYAEDDLAEAPMPMDLDVGQIPHCALHPSQVPDAAIAMLEHTWKRHAVVWTMVLRVLIAETVHLSPVLWDDTQARHWAFMFQVVHSRLYMHCVERLEGYGVGQDTQKEGAEELSAQRLPVNDVALMADPLYGAVQPNWRRAVDVVHLPSIHRMIWDINMWVVTDAPMDDLMGSFCKLWRKLNPHTCAMRDLAKIIREVMGECPQIVHFLLDLFLLFMGGAYEGAAPMLFYKWVWWQENVSAMGNAPLEDLMKWVVDFYLILHMMMRIYVSINVAGMPSVARLLGETYRDSMGRPDPGALRKFLFMSMDNIRAELCSKNLDELHMGNLVHMARSDEDAKRRRFGELKKAVIGIMEYLEQVAESRKETALTMNTNLIRADPCANFASITATQIKAVIDSWLLARLAVEEELGRQEKTPEAVAFLAYKKSDMNRSLSSLWEDFNGCSSYVKALVACAFGWFVSTMQPHFTPDQCVEACNAMRFRNSSISGAADFGITDEDLAAVHVTLINAMSDASGPSPVEKHEAFVAKVVKDHHVFSPMQVSLAANALYGRYKKDFTAKGLLKKKAAAAILADATAGLHGDDIGFAKKHLRMFAAAVEEGRDRASALEAEIEQVMVGVPRVFIDASQRARDIAKEIVSVANDSDICGAIRMYACYAAATPWKNPRFDLLTPLVGKELADTMMTMLELDFGDGRALNAMDKDTYPWSITDPVRLAVVNMYLVAFQRVSTRTVRPLDFGTHIKQLRALRRRYSLMPDESLTPSMMHIRICGCNVPQTCVIDPHGPPDRTATIGSKRVQYDRHERRIMSTHPVGRPECKMPVVVFKMPGWMLTSVGSKRHNVTVCVNTGAMVAVDMQYWIGGPTVGPHTLHRVSRFVRTGSGVVLDGEDRATAPHRYGQMMRRVVPHTNGQIGGFTSPIGIFIQHAIRMMFPFDIEAERMSKCFICVQVFGMKETEASSHKRVFISRNGFQCGFICNGCNESVQRFERRTRMPHGNVVDITLYREYMKYHADEHHDKALRFLARRRFRI